MTTLERPTTAELEIEALLFAAAGPLLISELERALPAADVRALISTVAGFWADRGMNVVIKGGAASMVPAPNCVRTVADAEGKKARKLSQAAVETLSFIAMHQPVSLADIERGRGVKLFKGVMDSLLDSGLVRASARRTDAGRAVSYVTTDAFLEHFGLMALTDLPTIAELSEIVSAPVWD